jgi:putative FmdB family regulatory protein
MVLSLIIQPVNDARLQMPIYAYKCSSCGHSRDVLQKVSDAPLTRCPQCQAETFAKQLTAAGFQLRGSGWYATDFKNGSGSKNGATAAKSGESDGADRTAKSAEKSAEKSSEKSADTAAAGACGHGGCSACS